MRLAGLADLLRAWATRRRAGAGDSVGAGGQPEGPDGSADDPVTRRAPLESGEGGMQPGPFPGRLFVVEGIDGSGKSTQLDLLHKWLTSRGVLVVSSEWNSSPIVRGTTRRGKRRRLFSPMTFSLIHCADLANRVYEQILPALNAGATVLADRYIYTAFARDAARGVNPVWLRHLYAFAPKPTMAFYFDVPLPEAIRRIEDGRERLKYYEAGMDLGLSGDLHQSFQTFQGMIQTEYERMLDEFGLITVDAAAPPTQQQHTVRKMVEPHLDGALQIHDGGLAEALTASGLTGRYLDELRSRR